LSKKRQIFRKFIGENILKIITSVPGHPALKCFAICVCRRTELVRKSNTAAAEVDQSENSTVLLKLIMDENVPVRPARVARFLLAEYTKTGKMYQITTKYTKRS
jgi:hypothetical protein